MRSFERIDLPRLRPRRASVYAESSGNALADGAAAVGAGGGAGGGGGGGADERPPHISYPLSKVDGFVTKAHLFKQFSSTFRMYTC